MAHTIVFKRSMSPTEKLTKTFDSMTLSLNVALKENTDMFKPTFLIQTSERLSNYNYIDGSSFTGRQYFIVDVRSVGNNRYEVDARTDVLSTWATQIKANKAVIKRQQKIFNLYLDDPDFHVLNYERIQTLQFPKENDFNKVLQYVIVTNGAGNSNQLEGKESESNGLHISELS